LLNTAVYFDYEDYSKKLDKYNIETISIFENNYPENLKRIEDAPFDFTSGESF